MSESTRAVPSDLEAIVECLTSAFFEDPLWGLWSFPDSQRRALGLPRLLGFWARAGIRHGFSWMIGPGQACSIWTPPGKSDTTSEDDAAFGPLIDELFGARAAEARALFELFEAQRPNAEPHYYLSLIATSREQAGRGLGTSLLRENLAHIDAERMPAYLESSNPANVERYERLGFRPLSRFVGPAGPLVTTMWRRAA